MAQVKHLGLRAHLHGEKRVRAAIHGIAQRLRRGLDQLAEGQALKLAPLAPVDTKQLCYTILTEEQKLQFEKNNELDLSFGVKALSRFRANVFMQRGAVAGAFRTIPFKVLTFEELGLPLVIQELCKKPSGLILVTGPTGSGKTTTLAAMIDYINKTKPVHIVTIEDPIEVLHKA